MLSATTTGGHKKADVRDHSGLLQIDIDNVGGHQVENLRDRIGDDRHILAAWVSPSGQGVKAIMRIPVNIERHRAAFEAAEDYMRENYGMTIDPACKDIARLCYVSHDTEISVNEDALTLEVPEPQKSVAAGVVAGAQGGVPLHLHNKSLTLHNKIFSDWARLPSLYQNLVTKRYGQPQRGMRNALVMREMVPFFFSALSPVIATAFAEEFYKQNDAVFSDYKFDTYVSEVKCILIGCEQSYPPLLTEAERAAYISLEDDNQRAAFRIARSLSKCESNANLPPPLFHLSCASLGARMGIYDMVAWRILKRFVAMGIIQLEESGMKRAKGQQGIATVYRWKLG